MHIFAENGYIRGMQIEIFSKVKDPRDLGKVKHELEDVLRNGTHRRVVCDCDILDNHSEWFTDARGRIQGRRIAERLATVSVW